MLKRTQKQKGFTIVELLIVVVVIAILAAITIVAYNGIQSRSKESAASAAVSQLGKKLAMHFQTNTNQYPADSSALATQIGYTLGANDRYIVNNSLSPAQYCLSTTKGTLGESYAISSTASAPIKGVCVTNLSQNPSFETTITLPTNTHYGATSTRVTGTGVTNGTYALRLHSTLGANGEAMRFIQGGFGNLGGFVPNTTYTFSADMTSLGSFANGSGSNQRQIRLRWSGGAVANAAASTQLPNSANSNRLYVTGAASADSTGMMLQVDHWGTATDPDIIVDGIMMTAGDTRYQYGDGSSAGWWWTGTAHESTSVGPAAVAQ